MTAETRRTIVAVRADNGSRRRLIESDFRRTVRLLI